MPRINRANRAISGTPPSWAVSGHTRTLKRSATNKYKAVLRDYREQVLSPLLQCTRPTLSSFVNGKHLPREYLPNHPAFEPPPVEQLRRFALYAARGKKGQLDDVPTDKTLCHKVSDLTSAIKVLTGYTYDDDTIADVQAVSCFSSG